MPLLANKALQMRLALKSGAPFDKKTEESHYVWTRRAFWLAALSLVGFYGFAAASWLLAGAVVPWDSKNHFYAMFRFLGDALHDGTLPLWNPYHFGGHPAIADPQSLIFTPTMALFALLAPNASMQLFDAIVLAHLLAGGICLLGLLRRWHWHPLGAVLTAILFMLGGAASARLQHTGIIISYSFFPAALWSLDVALERCSLSSALLFGLCASLLALGRDQVAFLLCITLLGYVTLSAAQSGQAFSFLRTRLGVLSLSAVVIVAAMAVPVLLTMQFLADSNRPGFAFGVAAAGSLAPVNLITLLVPNFFGSLDYLYDYWGPDNHTMPLADYTDRAVDYLFMGTLPFLLILWHGLAGGRLFERKARFFSIVALLATFYALGRYTPFFSLAFDWFPGVSLYRRPADATFLMNIGLALATGYLLHRFIVGGMPAPLRSQPRWRALLLAGMSVLALAALVLSGLDFSLREGRLSSSLAALFGAVLLAGGGVAMLSLLQARSRRTIAASLFVLLSGAELLWRNAASPLNAEPASRYSVYAGMKPAEAEGIALLRREIEEEEASGQRPRIEMLGLKGPWQNAAMVFKFENTLGYNPLRIDDYDRAVGTGQDAEELAYRRYPGTFRGYNSRLASLLGLEFLVLDRPLSQLPADIPRPRGEAIFSSEGMYIYKLGKAAPRAYFASIVKPVDDEDVLDDEVLPGFDPAHEALVDQKSMADLKGGPYPQSAAQERVRTASLVSVHTIATAAPAAPGATRDEPRVTIVSYTDCAVELDVDAPRAGIVVLHDLYYPGWEAFVDGKSETILRANVLFRGVEVGAGHHRVVFSFRPLSLANLKAAAAILARRKE